MKSNLKHYREHFEYKQKDAARIIGISAAHMSRLENNNREPALSLALKIAKFFDLSVEDIWSI